MAAVLRFIATTLRTVGSIHRRAFRRPLRSRQKSDWGDLVTAVDRQAERLIIQRIRRDYPSHAVLAEESAANPHALQGTQPLWVVDPLDGTINFAEGLPFFGISLAVAVRGVVVAGGVYDPLHDELFLAERGRGATCNGQRLRVNRHSGHQATLTTIVLPRGRTAAQMHVVMRRLSPPARRFTILGCTVLSLAYVAAGRIEGFVINGIFYPWDIAAGNLLIAEAGGRVTDWSGRPWQLGMRSLVATNRAVYPVVRRVVGHLRPVVV